MYVYVYVRVPNINAYVYVHVLGAQVEIHSNLAQVMDWSLSVGAAGGNHLLVSQQFSCASFQRLEKSLRFNVIAIVIAPFAQISHLWPSKDSICLVCLWAFWLAC